MWCHLKMHQLVSAGRLRPITLLADVVRQHFRCHLCAVQLLSLLKQAQYLAHWGYVRLGMWPCLERSIKIGNK